MPICTSAPLLGILLCEVVPHVEIIEFNKQAVVDELVCDALRLHGGSHPRHPFRRTVLGAEDCWMHILPTFDKLEHEAYILVAWYILQPFIDDEHIIAGEAPKEAHPRAVVSQLFIRAHEIRESYVLRLVQMSAGRLADHAGRERLAAACGTIEDDVLAGLDEDARRDVDEHGPVKLPFREEEHRGKIRLRVLEPCIFRQGPDSILVLYLIELVYYAVDTLIECHRHRLRNRILLGDDGCELRELQESELSDCLTCQSHLPPPSQLCCDNSQHLSGSPLPPLH